MSTTSTSNDIVPRTGTFGVPGTEGGGDTIPRKPRVSSQLVVLVIVLGVSAASVASMRHIGAKSGMNLQVKDVAQQPTVQDDTPEKAARYDRIMKDLQQLQQPLDIALGNLAKIPSLIATPEKIAKHPGVGEPPPPEPQDEMAKLLAEDRARFAKIRLQSVMGGRVPLARIDGKFYRLGDLVDERFIVKSIEDRSAVLEAHGESYELQMELSRGVGTSATKPKR